MNKKLLSSQLKWMKSILCHNIKILTPSFQKKYFSLEVSPPTTVLLTV